jgi:hypothetical protein
VKKHKYNVKKEKPVYKNIKFDSKLEMGHYKLFELYDEIEVIELQPFFMLMEGFTYYDIEQDKIRKYGKFSYKSDFKLDIKGIDKPVIWESKGMITQAYSIRKKIWYSIYGEDYYFIQCSSIKKAKIILEDLVSRGD